MAPRKSPAEMLWPRIAKRDNGCWEWTGYSVRGYGNHTALLNKGLSGWVHRAMYELIIGPIPEGWQVDHLCRNTLCCNPAHLEAVTPDENTKRSPLSASTVNATKTHCPDGHEYTPENTQITNGKRHCRQCRRVGGRHYRHNKAGASNVSNGDEVK